MGGAMPMIFLMGITLIVGIVLIMVFKLYLIGQLSIRTGLVVMFCGYYTICRRCKCRKHQNKIIFDENAKVIYWYWNNTLQQEISYDKFSRMSWQRYCLHDQYYANVYIVPNDQKPLRFNWYLSDISKAEAFTNKVNRFWVESQDIS